MKIKPIFRVYVEGGLYQETASILIAKRVAARARAEGWNVAVYKHVQTIFGSMATRIDGDI